MAFSAKTANRIWLFSQKKQYRLFMKNSRTVEAFQLEKLRNYINTNKNTTFGRQHNFSQINNYSDYISRVPVQDWTAIENYVKRIEIGEKNVLTQADIIRFEETSGTTNSSKLIPYTDDLLTEFQSAVACWMCALYEQSPQVFDGKAYWSISPVTRQQRKTEGGIPIGAADDKAYFNPFVNLLLNKILAVPPQMSKLEADDFYLQTLSYLLAEESLSFVSAWSPSFLLAMDDFLQKNKERLLVCETFVARARRRRRDEVKDILSDNFTWEMLWKNLQVVSCWTDAQAGMPCAYLQSRLGDISIQGKGLLSTECVCSVPVFKGEFPALSYLSHFYEFREVNTEEIYLAHQLEKGRVYEIIVTTGGGLYRYATADLIEVTGFFQQIPCFKFLGRKNKQSDLVGEKISELQINKIINSIFATYQTNIEWVFVAPEKTDDTFYHYVLNIELKKDAVLHDLAQITTNFERLLSENPYYREAVGLGQLRPMRGLILPNETRKKYLNHIKNKGQAKEAVIKNTTLISLDNYLIIKEIITSSAQTGMSVLR